MAWQYLLEKVDRVQGGRRASVVSVTFIRNQLCLREERWRNDNLAVGNMLFPGLSVHSSMAEGPRWVA